MIFQRRRLGAIPHMSPLQACIDMQDEFNPSIHTYFLYIPMFVEVIDPGAENLCPGGSYSITFLFL